MTTARISASSLIFVGFSKLSVLRSRQYFMDGVFERGGVLYLKIIKGIAKLRGAGLMGAYVSAVHLALRFRWCIIGRILGRVSSDVRSAQG